jgi:hypothetical protein
MFKPQALHVMQTLSSQIGFLSLQLSEKDSIIIQQNARIQELESQLEPKGKDTVKEGIEKAIEKVTELEQLKEKE